MILLLAGLVVALVAALLTGGSVFALASVTIRLDWVLLLGILGLSVLPRVAAAGVISSAVLLAVWALIAGLSVAVCAANRHVPWLWLVALGLLANMLVVVSNGGMPVLTSNVPPEALAAATAALDTSWLHHSVGASTRMPLLADVIPLALWGRAWGMASLGDLFMALGASAALYSLLQRPGGGV